MTVGPIGKAEYRDVPALDLITPLTGRRYQQLIESMVRDERKRIVALLVEAVPKPGTRVPAAWVPLMECIGSLRDEP